jgi:ribonuclease T2
MKRFLPLILTALVVLATGCLQDFAPAPAAADATGSPAESGAWPTLVPSAADFDYYVLALSWAPDYCSSNPGDTQECSLGRKFAFVLHGLWPQYATGYPSDCGGDPLPASAKALFPNLYPNDKLFGHEWTKHGTCSGLSPVDYLAAAQQLKDRIRIPAAYRAPAEPFRTTPDDLRQAFLQDNPDLLDSGLAVKCSDSGRYLSELQVCFSKAGQPASCGADVLKSARKSCPNADLLVRSVR